MDTAQRASFLVQITIPPNQSINDSVEWVQKYFDFFHPTLEAQVSAHQGDENPRGVAPTISAKSSEKTPKRKAKAS